MLKVKNSMFHPLIQLAHLCFSVISFLLAHLQRFYEFEIHQI